MSKAPYRYAAPIAQTVMDWRIVHTLINVFIEASNVEMKDERLSQRDGIDIPHFLLKLLSDAPMPLAIVPEDWDRLVRKLRALYSHTPSCVRLADIMALYPARQTLYLRLMQWAEEVYGDRFETAMAKLDTYICEFDVLGPSRLTRMTQHYLDLQTAS